MSRDPTPMTPGGAHHPVADTSPDGRAGGHDIHRPAASPPSNAPELGQQNDAQSAHQGRGPAEGSRVGRIPEVLRRAVSSGVSALMLGEEGLRNAMGEMRLPKDLVHALIQQSDKTRRELSRVVGQEVKGFLRNADLAGELRRALIGLKLQVRAEVGFGAEGPSVAMAAEREAATSGAASAADAPATPAVAAPPGAAPSTKAHQATPPGDAAAYDLAADRASKGFK